MLKVFLCGEIEMSEVKVYYAREDHVLDITTIEKQSAVESKYVRKSDYDKLEVENRILKAKLEKCKNGQVNMYHSEWSGGDADTEKFRAELELELDSITIDSIKIGEK